MSHIIKNVNARALGKVFAAVRVNVKGDKLILQDQPLMLIKPDTLIAPLPEKYKVYNSDGEEIKPSNKFYITAETINPYHLILDME